MSTTNAHLWVSINIASRPRYSTFDPDRWTDMAMSNETFCDFFCDHDRWTTLRRMISARILYQHSIGLGVLSPKVNWKCFVKMYIITNPARFHSNPVMKPLAKIIKLAQARTYLAMTKTSVPIKSELLIDKLGRQWAHNNVQNGPRLLIYFFVNSWKRNFSFFFLISTQTHYLFLKRS